MSTDCPQIILFAEIAKCIRINIKSGEWKKKRESSGGGAEDSHPDLWSDGLWRIYAHYADYFPFSPGGLPFITVQAVFLQGAL